MTTAYIVTAKVRHLSAWTADAEDTAHSWRSGRHRPLCGVAPLPWNDGRQHLLFPSRAAALDPENVDEWAEQQRRLLARAMQLPVCKPCADELASLIRLADKGTP